MKLILSNKVEIQITKKEAEQIERALLSGTEFVKIGDEVFNTKFVIGIFGSSEPEPILDTARMIKAAKEPKRDLESIKNTLRKMRKELEEKGILKLKE